MLIELEDKVIILDEAHNMEDSAREAASLSVTHIQISEVLKEITELCMLNHHFFYLFMHMKIWNGFPKHWGPPPSPKRVT